MKRLLLALLFSLWCSVSMAAGVTLDANATAPVNTSGASFNFTNLTVGTGNSNYALIASFIYLPGGTTTSMTWGSQSMTNIVTWTDPFGNVHEMWGLIAPQSGNQTLAVVMSASTTNLQFNATSFYNVNQAGGSTTFYNPGHASGTSTSPRITVASAIGDVVVEASNAPGNGSPGTSPLGTTLWLDTGGSSADGSYIAGAASVTLGWTISSQNWGEQAVAIAAAGGATGQQTQLMMVGFGSGVTVVAGCPNSLDYTAACDSQYVAMRGIP